MLREQGRVVAVEQEAVWVETIRSSVCGRCAAKAGCGQGMLGRASSGKGLIRVQSSTELAATECAIDDYVDIELPESVILRGSLLVYLLPLGLATALAVAGDSLGEVHAIAGFALGLGVGLGLVRWIPVLTGSEEQFEPRLAAKRRGDQSLQENMIASG